MTAVEWLWGQIPEILPFTVDTETGIKLYQAYQKAKQKEKEQIIESYRDGRTDQQSKFPMYYNRSAEGYYNELKSKQ